MLEDHGTRPEGTITKSDRPSTTQLLGDSLNSNADFKSALQSARTATAVDKMGFPTPTLDFGGGKDNDKALLDQTDKVAVVIRGPEPGCPGDPPPKQEEPRPPKPVEPPPPEPPPPGTSMGPGDELRPAPPPYPTWLQPSPMPPPLPPGFKPDPPKPEPPPACPGLVS